MGLDNISFWEIRRTAMRDTQDSLTRREILYRSRHDYCSTTVLRFTGYSLTGHASADLCPDARTRVQCIEHRSDVGLGCGHLRVEEYRGTRILTGRNVLTLHVSHVLFNRELLSAFGKILFQQRDKLFHILLIRIIMLRATLSNNL